MTKCRLSRHALLLVTLVVWLIPSISMAAGRVKWRRTTLEEIGESWKIDVEIHLNRAPSVAHIPMRFSFKPTTYYERTLVDNHDGPILRKVPLKNRQPIVESVDVGFMDPGRGEIQKRTRFTFKITRAHGFEAGEYQVTIKNGRTGGQIGRSTRLILQGENEVIDRRSMVFTGNDKKKKKDEETTFEEEPREEPKNELGPEDDAFWAGGPTEPEPEGGPPPIEEKPGGCGCRVAERGDGSAFLPAAGMLLALAAMRRRRRGRVGMADVGRPTR